MRQALTQWRPISAVLWSMREVRFSKKYGNELKVSLGRSSLNCMAQASAICLSRRFRFGTILARGDAMPLPEHLGKGQRVGITDHVGDLCY